MTKKPLISYSVDPATDRVNDVTVHISRKFIAEKIGDDEQKIDQAFYNIVEGLTDYIRECLEAKV